LPPLVLDGNDHLTSMADLPVGRGWPMHRSASGRNARLVELAEGTVGESSRVGIWHVVRELRGGFVLRPGVITLALAALAVGLAKLEANIMVVQEWSDFLDHRDLADRGHRP
jgi:hypothetical protein